MSEIDLSTLPPRFAQAVEAIRSKIPAELAAPKWGIVCGSGLSDLASSLEQAVHVPYSSIPGFAESSVEGHQSWLAFGYITSSCSDSCASSAAVPSIRVPVVACLGRFHTYEGHSSNTCVFPTRVFRLLGVTHLIITNAAGGLTDDLSIGTIMAIHDHLSLPTLTSMNPLIGPNHASLGPRFPPLSNAYDLNLRLSLYRAAQQLGLSSLLVSGTYAYVLGPSYESRAEANFLKNAGANAVGMSTVPEVIAAIHMGMKVLAISLITNKVILNPPFSLEKILLDEAKSNAIEKAESKIEKIIHQDITQAANHNEVLTVSKLRAQDMRRLVTQVILTSQV
ncbi:related to PNP1 - purine-nucleoside phosphorylase [Ustilago sp. UG-2017a]|nr:related to PNP1 - purine-nucleoside phosphorylase [Ustilago sp. UG-2017a]